jgi:hypothetical protein
LTDKRLTDLQDFYSLLDAIAELSHPRVLSECSGRLHWPDRGVYFFMEEGERRSDSGVGPRVVRVGTHALTATSRTTLWNRLSQHRGQQTSGGGNHRGSIFRLIVGTALIAKHGYDLGSWGVGNNAQSTVRVREHALECEVSKTIGSMPFLWLGIDDFPGTASSRGYIERNAIALLSNFEKSPIDPPSPGWLGHLCNRERVRRSGLWNQNHVDERYDPAFLSRLERFVSDVGRAQ